MTNDKILMNLIEAITLSMDSKKKSQDEAVKILDKTMAFLKHRNPEKNGQNEAFTRTETKI